MAPAKTGATPFSWSRLNRTASCYGARFLFSANYASFAPRLLRCFFCFLPRQNRNKRPWKNNRRISESETGGAERRGMVAK
jgi:hypothetical protein